MNSLTKELSSFWLEFAENYWERAPFQCDTLSVPLPTTPERLFETCIRCCEHSLYRRVTVSRSIADYVDQRVLRRPYPWQRNIRVRFIVESDDLRNRVVQRLFPAVVPRKFLPRRSDGSLQGYHERISSMLNPAWYRAFGLKKRRYALIINNLELADFELWTWTRDFLAGLYKHVGMNNGGTYYALFIGDYVKTAFGVHWDPESVFHLPIIGSKGMRTWPSRFVEENPALKFSHHYERYVDVSTYVVAKPGGFVYWPSDMWHVAESDGDLSASLALSLIVKNDPSAIPQIGRVGSSNGSHSSWDKKTVRFDPERLQESIASIPNGLVTPQRQSPTVNWLELATGMGCLYRPASSEHGTIDQNDVIRGDPEYPVVYLGAPGGRRFVAANGHVFSCVDKLPVEGLMDEINLGKPTKVSDLIARHACSGSRNELLDLLSCLFRVRAVVKASEDTSRMPLLRGSKCEGAKV